MSAEPTKEQTTEVFKRLRHHAANKMCFDCKSTNPSWASIPHGIYLCLQCSGVHRNLGVHLSFVRSTQMDTWTWHQLRCMQAGGNSAATAWFRDHSVTNQDVNAKYSSRGAQLYRAHLEKEASKLDKKLGDQLFEKEKPEEERDVDFFEASAKEAAAGADAAAAAPRLSASASLSKPAGELTASLSGAAGAGSKPAGKKIGGGLKKKAGGIGKKKVGGGLGAVKKTTTNFDEIEKKVTAEDAEREQHESANSPTDGDTERSASSRLKYQESSTKRDISKMNEQKREQAERLGMGMGRATTNKAVFSHSSSAAVQKIDTDYEEGETSRSGFLDREPRGFQDSLGFAGERRSPYDYDDH